MPSKPLAYGLFVVACIASAGGGAYFALRQPGGQVAPATSLSADGASATVPQPVASVVTSPTTDSSSNAAAPTPPVATTNRAPAREAVIQPPAPPLATRQAAPNRKAEATLPAPRPSSDEAGVSMPPPRAVEALSQASNPAPLSLQSQGVDPGSSAQRPWPGPPVSQPQFQQLPPASAAAVELAGVEQAVPDDERSRHWDEVVVPAESVIGLELESTINTEFARIEDQVDARVTRDVRVGGRVAIPAGTLAIGSVTMVERGGPVKTRARLGFRFHTLVFADRSRVPISTDAVYRMGESPGNQSSAKIGGAAIGGAIIGAILGGGRGAAIGSGIGAAGGAAAAMHGGRLPVVVPAGTTLSVRTQSAFSLTVEK
jgi:hypothetical protein